GWELTQVDPIGKAGSAFVKQNQPAERAQPVVKVSERWLSPADLQMRDPTRHPDDVDGPIADHLICDVHVPRASVSSLRGHGVHDPARKVGSTGLGSGG